MRRTARRELRGAVAVGAVLAAGRASADPDLVLHHAPVALQMRIATAAARSAGVPATSTSAPAAPTAPAPAADAAFHPLPTSVNDLHDRVTFRVNAGYGLDAAPASGDPLRGGAALAPGFSGSRSWVVGDAMVSAHDIVLPSLGGYFLAGYQFDTGGTLASQSALVVPGDANDQRVAIKAGYAEYQTDDKDGEHVWFRAGRQFRLDGGSMFAYFDGVSAGYHDRGLEVSGFGGERVVLFVTTPGGATFGATASADLAKLYGLPAKVGLDYMGLATTINDGFAVPGADVQQLRQLVAATGDVELSSRAHVELRARAVDGGTGLAFGRAGAHVHYAASRDLAIVADLDQRGAGDLAYDLASPTAVDVVDLSRRLGVGLAAPTTTTLIGGNVDWRRGNRELLGFARANVAEGTVTSVDQESWIEAGAAAAGAPVAGIWTTLQYTFRGYFLDAAANAAGSQFADTSGSGLRDLHELAVDGWWRDRATRRWRIGAGVFYRIYHYETPYVTVDHEGRGGGRVDAQYLLTTTLHVIASGEVAQTSPTTMPEIGTMSSVRVAMEAKW